MLKNKDTSTKETYQLETKIPPTKLKTSIPVSYQILKYNINPQQLHETLSGKALKLFMTPSFKCEYPVWGLQVPLKTN